MNLHKFDRPPLILCSVFFVLSFSVGQPRKEGKKPNGIRGIQKRWSLYDVNRVEIAFHHIAADTLPTSTTKVHTKQVNVSHP